MVESCIFKKNVQNGLDCYFNHRLGSGKGLLIHNAFRKKHHAPPLIWNTEMAGRAKKMATEMATKGTLDVALVKSVTKYGENVARISGIGHS